MSNKIELAVFDMAGTTVDEQNVVYKTLQQAIVNENISVDLNTVLVHGAGKEKHQAIKDVLRFLNIEDKDSLMIFNNFKSMLNQAYEVLDVKPIKGAKEALQNLKNRGVKTVLNTGYSRDVAIKLLHKMNWKEGVEYDALITASDVKNGRPQPEMIEKAMELFKITDALKVLKIGDSIIDIEEGKNANCGVTIGVLSGAQTRAQLITAKPSYILNSIEELAEVLWLNGSK